MAIFTLYLIAFIILFIVAIILSKKLHNNNILALTQLLQTKNISKKLLPKNKEPIDIGSFIVYN